MKRFGLCIAAALALAALTPATAQDQEYVVRYAPGAEFPDDPASEAAVWSFVNFVELDRDDFTAHGGGTHNGNEDASGRFLLLWSEEGLFLMVEVTDDSHLNTNAGGGIWNGDSVQVVFEPTGERRAGLSKYEYNFGLGAPNSATPHFARAFNHPEAPPMNTDDFYFMFERVEEEKLTKYVVFFPVAHLAPAVLEVDSRIGMGMVINDGDDEPGQQGQKGWLGWGANSVVFAKDTSQTNLLILSEESLSVDPAGKLAASWAAIKTGR
ncbi:MAG: hypothetical protein OXT69_05960 [Candidatus Poribacteria bacterium]|nr:hypothetical protein [Candidatus Poribacteria bacterium]